MTQSKKLDRIAQAKEMWQFVRHHFWLVLLGGVLLSAAALVALSRLPRFYMASTTVLVDPQRIPGVKDIDTMDPVSFNALSEQVMSTTRLQRIINDLHLCSGKCSISAMMEGMTKNITIEAKSGGAHNLSAFTLSYQATDPKVAAAVVTRLAEGFMDWDTTAREQQASRVGEFLTAEQREAKQTLDAQEAKLEEFKTEHVSELAGAGPSTANLSRLQAEAQADAAAIDRLGQEKSSLAEVSESRAESTSSGASERTRLEAEQRKLQERLTSLRTRYSEEYPDVAQTDMQLTAVQEQLSHLPPLPTNSAVPGSPSGGRLAALNSEIEMRQEERSRMLAQISDYQAKVDRAPLLQQQLSDLTRDYEDARTHYMSLFDKDVWAKTATELLSRQEAGRFAIQDPALVPDRPVKSHMALLTPLVVPFCFLLAAATAIFVEKILKGTTGTEAALREQLPDSVAVMGRIPVIETPQSMRRKRQLAVLSATASLMCWLATDVYLHKLPMTTFAATGSVVCALAAVVFLKAQQRRTAEGAV